MFTPCSRPPAAAIVRAVALSALLVALLPQPLRADPAGDYKVAVEFYNQERWDLAVDGFQAFLKAWSKDPLAPAARLYLGQALVAQSRFAEARDAFRDYARLTPEAPGIALARFRLAECSYFLKEDAPALAAFDEYLSKHPGHELAPRARLYRGLTQLRLKDPAAAASTLQDLIDRKPEAAILAEATLSLAQAQERLGKTDEAIKLYEQLAGDPSSPFAADSHFRLGSLAFNAADYPRAADHFVAVATGFPDHQLAPIATLNAGYAEYSLGHTAAALARFEKAAADPQQAAIAGMWIGLTHKQAGDLPQAAAAFRATYEKDTQQQLADKLVFHWGDCELRRGDYHEALRLFTEVADRWPAGERADDSLHLATEAALRAGDLDEAARIHARFENEQAASSLRWRQQILAGRIDLARGDALAAANEADPAAAESYRRAADRLARVVAESEVAANQLDARVQLGRAHDRLNDPAQVIAALEPVAAAFRDQQGTPDLADGLILLAHAFNSAGRHADAAGAARLYVDQPNAADAPAALTELALAQVHLNEEAALTAALDELVKLDASGLRAVAATYQCAEIAYAAKNWTLAATLFARAATFDASAGYRAAALSGLGYARHEAGEHAQAAAAFTELLELAGVEPRLASNAAHMRGLSLQMAGSADDAIAAYQEGLRKFAPADGDAPAGDAAETARNAYRCGKGAARLLREAERIDESDAAYEATFKVLTALPAERQSELDRFLSEWALLSYEHQRYERSDELFKRLVELRPDSDLADDARLYLGESQFFGGNKEEAEAAFAALVQEENADEFVRHRASLLLLDITADREQWEQLLERADQFREQFPTSTQQAYARYRAGEAALQLDQLERAVDELTALADLQDEKATEAEWYTSVYVLLAEAQFRAKDYPAVEKTVEAFRQRFPGSPLLYHADEVLGRSYIKRAMFDEGRTSLSKVVDSETGRRTQTAARAQFHIAESYLIEKDYRAALREYYKVYINYQFPEWQAVSLFQSGQCDESLENWQAAKENYEKLLQEFPDHEYAEQARQRITAISSRTD